MMNYVVKRVLTSVPALFVTVTLIFLLVRVVPGDPAIAILGDQATPEAVRQFRIGLGLDRPLYVQYFDFMVNLMSGDFGISMITRRPVLTDVATALPYTIDLTLAAMVIGIVLGIPAGVLAARYQGKLPDLAVRFTALLGLSFPVFVSAIFLLLVFAVHWRIFPVVGGADAGVIDRLHRLVLPSLSLGVVMAAYIARVTRSGMLTVLREDYIRTAYAKGLLPGRVVWRHALQNASLPVITMVGLYVGIMIGNSVLTEIVFNRPGIGKLIVNAMTQRDYTMIQSLIVIYCSTVIVVNLLTDIVYGLADPRIKLS